MRCGAEVKLSVHEKLKQKDYEILVVSAVKEKN